MCGVAALARVDGDRVVHARACYLSLADVPTVVDLTTATDDPAGAGELALEHLDPVADLHASADYRAQLVRVLTGRVLRAAVEDARARQGALA
jgi:carbon-monoxide dehydrogenase medium subunit